MTSQSAQELGFPHYLTYIWIDCYNSEIDCYNSEIDYYNSEIDC